MVSKGLRPVDLAFLGGAENQGDKGQYLTPTVIAERLAEDISELSGCDPEVIHDLGCGPGVLAEAVLERFPKCKAIGYDIDEAALDVFRERFKGRSGGAHPTDLLLNPIKDGIDHAISNPPYLLSRRIGRKRTKQIRKRGYFSTAKGKLNTFGLFIEMAVRALNQGGVAAFIVPHGVANLEDHEALRALLIKECDCVRITWMTDQSWFKDQGVDVETCLISFRKGRGVATLQVREWDGRSIRRENEIDPKEYHVFPTPDLIELDSLEGEGIAQEFQIVAKGFNWSSDWQEYEDHESWKEKLLPVARGSAITEEGEFTRELRINYQLLEKNGAITRKCSFELHASSKPRLILADISQTIRVAFVDEPTLPMNSVKVIFHEEDNVDRLKELAAYLTSDDAFQRLKAGSPNIHLTKSNLETIRLPGR